MINLLVQTDAIISDCQTYRYSWFRDFYRCGPTVSIGMVNPSTADAEIDDATIRKVCGFADRLRWGRVIVWNLFAFRTAHVSELAATDQDPVGPDNDRHIEVALSRGVIHVVAWGRNGKLAKRLRTRWLDVMALPVVPSRSFQCWGTNDDGHPRHPLMLAYDTPLVPWSPPDMGDT